MTCHVCGEAPSYSGPFGHFYYCGTTNTEILVRCKASLHGSMLAVDNVLHPSQQLALGLGTWREGGSRADRHIVPPGRFQPVTCGQQPDNVGGLRQGEPHAYESNDPKFARGRSGHR